MILTVAFGAAAGFMFIAVVMIASFIGPYGWAVVKAKMGKKHIAWFINNHGEVFPEAVSGDIAHNAYGGGIFYPDPDSPITTDHTKGSLFDTNLAPGLSYSLLTGSKKLSKLNVPLRRPGDVVTVEIGESEETFASLGDIEGAIYEADILAESAGDVFENQALSEFKEVAEMADTDLEKAKEKAISDFRLWLGSERTEEAEPIFSELLDKLADEYGKKIDAHVSIELEKTVSKYASSVEKLKWEFVGALRLNDPEIKSFRRYFRLCQPQYVERIVQDRVVDAVAGAKDWIKPVIVAGVIAMGILGILGLIIYLTQQDPTVIIQSAELLANNTTNSTSLNM